VTHFFSFKSELYNSLKKLDELKIVRDKIKYKMGY
jgi:hypothetical protein